MVHAVEGCCTMGAHGVEGCCASEGEPPPIIMLVVGAVGEVAVLVPDGGLGAGKGLVVADMDARARECNTDDLVKLLTIGV